MLTLKLLKTSNTLLYLMRKTSPMKNLFKKERRRKSKMKQEDWKNLRKKFKKRCRSRLKSVLKKTWQKTR